MTLALFALMPVALPAIAVTPLKPIPGAKALAFAAAPTGSKFVATLEDGTVRIYDAATRATLKTLGKHPQAPYGVAWSPNGKLIASGDESARIYIWDAASGKKVKEYRTHTKGIQNLTFSPSGAFLLSTAKDDSVKIYPMLSNNKEATIPGKGANFYSAKYLGTSGAFGVATLTSATRLFAPDNSPGATLSNPDAQGCFDLAFNRSATRAATAGKDGTVTLWDVVAKKRLGGLKGHTDWVMHCEFAPSGRLLASSSSDRTVRLWDPISMKSIGTLQNQTAVGAPLCFTADGKYLLTVNFDDAIQVNAVAPAQPEGKIPKPPIKKKKRK